MRRRKAELVAARMLSPSVRSLVFHLQGPPLAFLSGQYIDVLAPAAQGLVHRRSYSVASAPSATSPDLEIAVTRVEAGPLSTALHEMPVGSLVEIEGPAGNFIRPPSHLDLPAIFVATGTGLAPFRAMLADELPRSSEGPPILLLFGCRTERDILWSEDLSAWKSHPRFRLEVTLSRPGAAFTGRRGYVQTHLAELSTNLLPAHLYVCGLARMVDEVVALATGPLGIDRARVHYETYD